MYCLTHEFSEIQIIYILIVVQQHDPDLPPELAAATGIDEISSENQDIGKANMHSDLPNGSSHARMQLV